MADYFVESVFEHEGLKCAVLLQKMGHRCGYVGIPESHPDFGKHYEKVDVLVHGGLTYSNGSSHYPIETDEGLWWFGFDCAHCDDMMDYDAVIEKMPEHTSYVSKTRKIFEENPIPGMILWTQEMVEDECRRLAEQLKGEME